jgi:KAP family P-loop domain
MWPDNETELDFLNFTGVADTVAEIIVQANGSPISIGVSGAWGLGKSSMIRLMMKAASGLADGLVGSSPRPQIVFPAALSVARPSRLANTARGLAIARSYAIAGKENAPGSNR